MIVEVPEQCFCFSLLGMQKILERPWKAARGVRAEVGASSGWTWPSLSSKTASPGLPSAPSPDGYPEDHSITGLSCFIWSLIKLCLKQLPHQECEAMQANYTLTVLQYYNVIEYPQTGEPFNGKKYNLLLCFWGFYIFTFAKLSRIRNRRLILKLINSISGYVRGWGCVNLNSRILFD